MTLSEDYELSTVIAREHLWLILSSGIARPESAGCMPSVWRSVFVGSCRRTSTRSTACGNSTVLVDGETVVDAGALAVVGFLPTGKTIVDVVHTRITGH